MEDLVIIHERYFEFLLSGFNYIPVLTISERKTHIFPTHSSLLYRTYLPPWGKGGFEHNVCNALISFNGYNPQNTLLWMWRFKIRLNSTTDMIQWTDLFNNKRIIPKIIIQSAIKCEQFRHTQLTLTCNLYAWKSRNMPWYINSNELY